VRLRTDVHAAFDAIAPTTGGMAERITETARRDHAAHHRRKFMFQMRAPVSLVAILMVIVLVIGALVGGRLVQEWNALNPKPSASDRDFQTQLAGLEARPLRLPVLKSAADCRLGPFDADGGFGSGPLSAYPGTAVATNWGFYYHNVFYTDTAISGPILVRVRDLYTGGTIVFIGPGASGPTVGTDVVDGQTVRQHTELVLDPAHVSTTIAEPWNPPAHNHRYVWTFIGGAPDTWSGSTGWQIDGNGFSEIFLAC
jgi:hypothetical protein